MSQPTEEPSYKIPLNVLNTDCFKQEFQTYQCSKKAEERGPGQKVIAYSLYGKLNQRYFRGLEENLRDVEVNIYKLCNDSFKIMFRSFTPPG